MRTIQFRPGLLAILLLLCLVPLGLGAQNILQRPKNPDYPGRRGGGILSRISATATVGSGWVNPGFDRVGVVGLGEVSVTYGLRRFLDVGISTGGSLLCNAPVPDGMSGTIKNPDVDGCTEAWTVGQTFSLVARYFPLPAWPAFAQLNAGYSLDGEAPFAALSAGWGQPVWDRFSLIGQVRYAYLFADGFDLTPGGLRLELGVGWNL